MILIYYFRSGGTRVNKQTDDIFFPNYDIHIAILSYLKNCRHHLGIFEIIQYKIGPTGCE
jgi:hypothetical protein